CADVADGKAIQGSQGGGALHFGGAEGPVCPCGNSREGCRKRAYGYAGGKGLCLQPRQLLRRAAVDDGPGRAVSLCCERRSERDAAHWDFSQQNGASFVRSP